MTNTPRLDLPHLVPGQMSKEITHNEALERIDMAVQPVVAGGPLSAPPSGAVVGDSYLVASGATDEWAGQDDALAMRGAGGWLFLSAFDGMTVFDAVSGATLRFRGGAWAADALVGPINDANGNQVVGTRQGAIGLPAGGSTKDTQARTAIGDLVAALAAHGLIAAS